MGASGTWRKNISFLLVDTYEPGNIGSAARALKNMGFRNLRLVRPRDAEAEEARKLAVGAYDLIRQADRFDHLEEALRPEHRTVAATSLRGRTTKTSIYPIRELAPRIRRWSRTERVTLVFGPERRGLTEEQLACCGYLTTIPASSEFPVLNLSQAVLIAAYELHLCSEQKPTHSRASLTPAAQADLERFYAHLEEILLAIGFLSSTNPGHIMRQLKRVFARAELTPRDVRILRGILSQMDWYRKQGHRLRPEDVHKP